MIEAAAVACRGGLLAPARPGSRARAWGRRVDTGSAPAPARRRLLVASIGVGEPLPARSPGEDPVAELEADEDAGSAEILPPSEAKTVRVKFVLKKQCEFGQQFLLVGDDPALGLWDPAKAAALDWSEGHDWTVMTDLPANKLIEFKFLLREASGQIRWQHGSNRTLQTTDTTNTLVVHEDWDHVKNQKLTEKDISIEAEDVDFSDDFAASNAAMLADPEEPAVVAYASLNWEPVGTNEANQQKIILGKDHNILDELRGEATTVAGNGNPSADYNGERNDEPGNGNASIDHSAGRNDDDTTLCQEGALPTKSIFENDLAWAKKALQQVLRTLGF